MRWIVGLLSEYNISVPALNPLEFYRNLEEVLYLQPGTLKGGEALADLDVWDSVDIMGFIAMADEKYGVIIPEKRIPKSATVEDLAGLIQEFSK
jgi:acyl carrier protein